MTVEDLEGDDFDLDIDWGDGATETYRFDDGHAFIEYSHGSDGAGTCTVTFTATDEHGNTSSAQATCSI